MKSLLLYSLLAATAPVALAQAPVEDARVNQNTLLQAQQKASAAYRDLRQAEFEAQRAEQDFRQADADYKSVQKRADELKRAADAAKKNLDAAKAKEAAAQDLRRRSQRASSTNNCVRARCPTRPASIGRDHRQNSYRRLMARYKLCPTTARFFLQQLRWRAAVSPRNTADRVCCGANKFHHN